jgi:hypothetical protein
MEDYTKHREGRLDSTHHPMSRRLDVPGKCRAPFHQRSVSHLPRAAHPTRCNSVKFFATLELLEQVKDRAWLVKMTNAVNQHWHNQNARKKNCPANGSQNGHVLSAGQSSAAGG